MEEKKDSGVGVIFLTMLIIGLILAVIGLSIYVIRLKNEKKDSVQDSNALIEKENISEEIIENDELGEIQEESVVDNQISYNITTRDEAYANIEATQNEKVISREIEFDAMIDKTEVNDYNGIGKVAVVSESGGEYLGIHFYKLVDDEIKELGTIDMGAEIVGDVEYTIDMKTDKKFEITATKNGETLNKDIEADNEIEGINIEYLLDYGKVVLVSEISDEDHIIKAYGLKQNYVTGELEDIVQIGTLEIF